MKKNNLKKVMILSTLAVPFMIRTVSAESYIANEWDTFKNRTKEQIVEQYEKSNKTGTYINQKSETYYKITPVTTSPYNAGELTTDTHKAMTTKANYYRWLVGVDPLTSSSHRDDLQAGALVRMSLDNFNHFLNDSQKLEGMSDELWRLGADAKHNIIAWGYTPTGSITGWLNEGYNLNTKEFDTTGHRQAILGSSISKLQFGYVSPTAIGDIVETNNTSDLAYTAFPVPGYMPTNILNVNEAAWNIVLNNSKLSYQDENKVKVKTNLNTKESYECTTENGKLSISGNELVFVQPSTNNYQYEKNTSYKVEVLGLTEQSKTRAVETNEADVSYTVNFFDVEEKTTPIIEEKPIKEEETTNNSKPSNESKPTTENQSTNETTNEKPESNTTKEEQNNKAPTSNEENTNNKVDSLLPTTNTEENPQTSDSILVTLTLFVVTIISSVFGFKYLKKQSNNKTE